ncbi:uncharacterized protein BCR38DRAFT_472979 [Pseudomassariella vexata]|uniref:Uncharacterized protein n=1 Tax=Pseudomassariella vexata TaxID=1141098 RepID=A0A1Y2E7S5_9PEZI|nr:uncharacterized protein BCR38DRAFT_472979 [Pseudomassariella vexata]ORY67618.1 hypothetical protein BCR38DRAFT_472979 [Pseudomassariella vexata]
MLHLLDLPREVRNEIWQYYILLVNGEIKPLFDTNKQLREELLLAGVTTQGCIVFIEGHDYCRTITVRIPTRRELRESAHPLHGVQEMPVSIADVSTLRAGDFLETLAQKIKMAYVCFGGPNVDIPTIGRACAVRLIETLQATRRGSPFSVYWSYGEGGSWVGRKRLKPREHSVQYKEGGYLDIEWNAIHKPGYRKGLNTQWW